MQIVRSEKEVADVIQLAENTQFASIYPGMSYEQGILYFFKWLSGEIEDNPMKD